MLAELKVLTRLCHKVLYICKHCKVISTMSLPNKYQNGSVDSTVKGVYRASPIKLMIYGNGKCYFAIERRALITPRNKQSTVRCNQGAGMHERIHHHRPIALREDPRDQEHRKVAGFCTWRHIQQDWTACVRKDMIHFVLSG
jgi:hypothetical protein